MSILTFSGAISASGRVAKTVSGPATRGVTSARSSSMRAAYAASGSGAGGCAAHLVRSSDRDALDAPGGEVLPAGVQPGERDLVHREPADEGAPLGRHVGDRHAGVHRERGDAVAGELERGVEHLLVVVEAAQGDDHVLAGDAGTQPAAQHHLDGARDRPPERPRGPDRGGVGAHDRRADRAEGAVHVRVRVGGDHERTGDDVPLLAHDLVPDPGAGGVEIDPVRPGERLDPAVLAEVLLGGVLDVVVEGEHRLGGVGDARRADPRELRHHRRGVVVRHHVVGADREEVPGRERAARALRHVRLRDLLDNGLSHTNLRQVIVSGRGLPPPAVGRKGRPTLPRPPCNIPISSVTEPSVSRFHTASLTRARAALDEHRLCEGVELLLDLAVGERVARVPLGVVELGVERSGRRPW